MMTAPQYITDDNGNKLSVILSMEDYTHMIEALEELEDIKLYDAAKADQEPAMLFEDYIKQRSLKQ